MSKLQGWVIPTSATKYADHTFVYCPDNGKYFGCWDHGRIDEQDAEMICSGSYENAYAVANCYRDSIGDYPDTAGIGVYLVNGVCHQSANCFLYAAGAQLSMKPDGRPRGLFASTAAYGIYGTGFGRWYATRYWMCSGKVDNLGASSKDPVFLETLELHESLRDQPEGKQAVEMKVGDLAILVKHTAPEVNLEAVADLQRSYLGEHEGFLQAELPKARETGVIDEKAAERVNHLSVQFQRSLSDLVGGEAYKKLTGLDTGETVDLADPRILEIAHAAAGRH